MEIHELEKINIIKRYQDLVTLIKLHPTINNYNVLKKAGIVTNYLSPSVYKRSPNANIFDRLVTSFLELNKECENE